MEEFLNSYQDIITGALSTFDRLIFKGHLSAFFPNGAFARFLSRQGVLLKNFGTYVETATQAVKTQAEQIARPGRVPLPLFGISFDLCERIVHRRPRPSD